MHKQTAEGGIITLDENQDHTLWPCVQHDPRISCNEAQRMWQDPRAQRTLRPQEPRYARYPTPPR
jgi:hypothetical protein